MTDDDRLPRCSCGHWHLTTLGPCTSWDTCGCPGHRVWHDTPAAIRRRRRDLLEALDECPHNLRAASRGVLRPRRTERTDAA